MKWNAVCGFILISLLFSGACGDDDGGADGGADASTDSGPPINADIPWLADGLPPIAPPVLTPCPTGWREVTAGELTICDPLPDAGGATCSAGEAHFVGTPGCAAVGDACPVGDFAEGLPAGALYVDADASPGGDGSVASPFTALSDVAWTGLPAGATIALARGDYDGAIPLKADVRLVGACAAETILTGIAVPVPSVLSVTSAGEAAVVRNVTIRSPPQMAALVERAGRSLRLEGVVIEGARMRGVWVDDGGELTLERVVVRNTRAESDGTFGVGAEVSRGGRLVASNAIFDGNRDHGIFVFEPGSEAVLADTIVRGTVPQTVDGTAGRAIGVQMGARVEVSRTLLEGNSGSALLVGLDDAEAVLVDVVVRDNNDGIAAQDGARLDASRLSFEGNVDTAVAVAEVGSRATLADIVVRDTLVERSGFGGRGLNVQGGTVEGARIAIERSHDNGIFIALEGTDVSLEDVVVRDTLADATESYWGRGVNVQGGAHFTLERALIERSASVGVVVMGPETTADLTDVVVRDNMMAPIDGRGLQSQVGARTTGTRVLVERTLGIGVATGSGGSLELSDVVVRDVAARACAASSCSAAPWGYGASAIAGEMRLTRFEVSGASLCGLIIADEPGFVGPTPTALDLASGVVAGAAIGACVQVDGYELTRLTSGVEFRDNGVNLDTTMLPVPTPLDSI